MKEQALNFGLEVPVGAEQQTRFARYAEQISPRPRQRRAGFRALPQIVPLPGPAAGPEGPQLEAERHSDKRAAFPGLKTGPVKGLSF